MNLDKPQSRYLNFVNVDFLSTTSYRSFVYTGQYLFIRVYTSTNARRPNGCPLSPTLCAPLRGIRELPQNNMNTSPRQPRQYPPLYTNTHAFCFSNAETLASVRISLTKRLPLIPNGLMRSPCRHFLSSQSSTSVA